MGSMYKAVLRDSNFVELQPEKIFLMENEELFVSNFKQYFAHFCEPYANHRCLNPSGMIDGEKNIQKRPHSKVLNGLRCKLIPGC